MRETGQSLQGQGFVGFGVKCCELMKGSDSWVYGFVVLRVEGSELRAQ